VETIGLDGEPNLKHKASIRDMQDAILSPQDASTINGHIKCDQPNDSLYSFDGVMTIRVKNSEDTYKYPLGYNQLLMRGTSLRSTQWVYGIVVYTGHETRMH
jgi:phospholipid-transporting ATPase